VELQRDGEGGERVKREKGERMKRVRKERESERRQIEKTE
jgi:hypothetical protein